MKLSDFKGKEAVDVIAKIMVPAFHIMNDDTMKDMWNKELSMFEIEGTEDQKAMFYTSLYHTMINPSVYMDVDGSYRGNDMEIHRADGFTNYTVFSLWDTYRAEHPLLSLLHPKR